MCTKAMKHRYMYEQLTIPRVINLRPRYVGENYS